MDKVIEVTNLCKSYDEVKAVNNLSFYVERGKFYAFLGPNGAGKTTTIDVICTALKPDSGSVTVDGFAIGKDDGKIRSVLGVVFQDNLLDSLLTVRENLTVRGSFYGLKGGELKSAVAKAAGAAGVSEFLNRPYGKLSGGQRRRADIARSLVNNPDILVLDEPTTGLDPQTRRNVWETIFNLQKQSGMTVFLTTHYMEEAANADYVIIIDNGEIAARGTPAELKEQYAGNVCRLFAADTNEVERLLEGTGLPYSSKAGTVTVKIPGSFDALGVIEKCREAITGFEVLNGTLEDVFLAITGKEIRE